MTVPGLAARQAPPFALPGEHFAAALVFLALGAGGLVLVAPDLARGAFPAGRVVGVTHLFTLGWITTSIMGALYQFLPVALGNPVPSVRLAHVTFALYAPGLLLFVAGLVAGESGAMLAGAAGFGAALVLFIGHMATALYRTNDKDVTWCALSCAVFFLAVTLVLGLALAGNLRWGYLGAVRFTAVGVHLHVAIGGWVLLVMVGVAHRLLPMFLLSHGAGDAWAKASVALLASGSGVLAFLHHFPPSISRWLPAFLMAGGLLCFLVQARRFYRHRNRPALDPGMRLAAIALGLLAVGAGLAGPVLLGAVPRVATAYVAALLLGISLFIAAHYYKIIPFLVWYHRYGPLAGRQPVPKVAELYSSRVAFAATTLLAIGAGALVGAVTLGAAAAARVAAGVFAAGVAVELTQMIGLARRRP